MTPRRKLTITASLAALAVTVALCWPRSNGYTHQGRTVEEWFEDYIGGPQFTSQDDSARRAFEVMGTNTVPFLVSRITRKLSPSWFARLQAGLRPIKDKYWEAAVAANLLRDVVKPPVGMLLPLLKPAMLSTDPNQRLPAIHAVAVEPVDTNLIRWLQQSQPTKKIRP